MMSETYTDIGGNRCTRNVPDMAKRARAVQEAGTLREQARSKKSQAAALRAQMAALDAGIEKLNNTISQTNTYICNLAERVQQADLYYAKQMGGISEATLAYINKIKALYHSFSETSLDIGTIDNTSVIDPRSPQDDPALTEKLFWDDFQNGNITYLKACEYFSKLGEGKTDVQRKALAENMAKQYTQYPERVTAINAFGNGAYQMPVNPVAGGTLGEGWPNYSGGAYHGGIDIKAPRGTPIVSATVGTVKKVIVNLENDDYTLQKNNPYGNYVVVELHNGDRIYYAHMQQDTPSVVEGDKVNPGDYIGNVGSSGNSSVDHLHVEIYTLQNNYNDHHLGKNPDPSDYISGLTT